MSKSARFIEVISLSLLPILASVLVMDATFVTRMLLRRVAALSSMSSSPTPSHGEPNSREILREILRYSLCISLVHAFLSDSDLSGWNGEYLGPLKMPSYDAFLVS